MTSKEYHQSRDDVGEFIDLMGRYHTRLFHYVVPMVRSIHDAEDVMQEVSRALWENFADFEQGTNFLAWARKVAYYRVLESRRAASKSPEFLPDDILSAVADEADKAAEGFSLRHSALQHCMKKLRGVDRKLIQRRYEGDVRISVLAETLGRPANSVYQSLHRIRLNLLACIEGWLANKDFGEEPSA